MAERKLSARQVTAMRQQYVDGLGVRRLARQYGIDYAAASLAIRGHTYKEIPGAVIAMRPIPDALLEALATTDTEKGKT